MHKNTRARLARYVNPSELAVLPYPERRQVAGAIRAALTTMRRLRFGFGAAMLFNAVAWALILSYAATHQ